MTETVKCKMAVDPVPRTENASHPPIASDSTVGAGLQVMLAASTRTLRGASRRGAPERAETIHRFRVGLRRLRSLISAFRKALPSSERRTLSGHLRAKGQRYGRVREWDVFLAETLPPLASALPNEPAISELEACARTAREHALPEAIDFGVEANEVAAAIDAASWLHRPRPEFVNMWDRNLKDFADELLEKRHRRLRKHLKAVNLGQQASLHKLRIEVKKTRYQVEIFQLLFEIEAVEEYLDRVVPVQDVLGHLNDALVAQNLITQLPLSSHAEGVANGWLAREVEARRQAVPHATKKLRKAPPFW